jgi:alkyldihydroxyacetonephosphate synthase
MAPSTHEKNIEHYQVLSNVASDALLELGATITHHHAVGRSFRPWYDKEIDPGFVRIMKAIKREIDPKWVLNPGILFDRPVS